MGKLIPNLVNAHDVGALLRRVRAGRGAAVLSGLLRGRRSQVRKSWEKLQDPPVNWWDIPAVQERWNRMVSGDAALGYRAYLARKYLGGRDDMEALSLGCGTGRREIKWLEAVPFRRIDAYDLSPQRIEAAQKAALEAGLQDRIRFQVAEMTAMDLPAGTYDLVLFEQSLHHFAPLRGVLCKVRQSLRPGGLLFLNEFVGPSRFQWTDRQLQAMNGLLELCPERHRILWESGSPKGRIHRPGLLAMRLQDPSEAAESERILPAVRELFEVLEVRGYGGALLHMLFSGIAHHFREPDAEARLFLDLCFAAEDLLMEAGEITSDFAVVAARRPAESCVL